MDSLSLFIRSISYRVQMGGLTSSDFRRWCLLSPGDLLSGGAFAKRNLIGIYANPERRAFNSDVDYARLKVWLTNEARSVGPYQQTEKTFNTQDGAALCFQFNRPESVEVRCFLDGSSVTVVFEGEPRFVDDVYQVVSGARKRGNKGPGAPGSRPVVGR
jgi:hypothetical protein